MKVLVLTDSDLDGSGSALAIKWLYAEKDANITVVELIGQDYSGIIRGLAKSFDRYDRIFITDSYVPEDVIELVDIPKMVIVDHHQDHINVADQYKHAKTVLKLYPSCCKLIVDVFKLELTDERKQLVKLINDYDSYQLEFKETLMLNCIFNTYNRPKVNKFIDAFYDGMREFTTFEKNAIRIYFRKVKETLDGLDVYKGQIGEHSVISFFVDHALNEVTHTLLKQTGADIAIAVAQSYGGVSFRRSKTCTAKLNVLAAALCDGGGHEYAAGGKITPKFLEFTKKLELC